jgi:hypothetical protein
LCQLNSAKNCSCDFNVSDMLIKNLYSVFHVFRDAVEKTEVVFI